jgi:hypothetical protein
MDQFKKQMIELGLKKNKKEKYKSSSSEEKRKKECEISFKDSGDLKIKKLSIDNPRLLGELNVSTLNENRTKT